MALAPDVKNSNPSFSKSTHWRSAVITVILSLTKYSHSLTAWLFSLSQKRGTYEFVPDGRDDLLVRVPEPIDLSHVDSVLVELHNRLGNVVLRHDRLVKLEKSKSIEITHST